MVERSGKFGVVLWTGAIDFSRQAYRWGICVMSRKQTIIILRYKYTQSLVGETVCRRRRRRPPPAVYITCAEEALSILRILWYALSYSLLSPPPSSTFLSLSLFLPHIFVLSLPSSLYNMLYYFSLLLLYSYSTSLKILLRIPRIISLCS